MGRKPQILNDFVIGKTLRLWEQKDALSFKEIHEQLLRLGIVSKPQNKMTTYRILRKLEELGYIEKKGKLWVLVREPPPFSPLSYALDKAKERNYVVRGDVGSILIAGFNLERLGFKFTDETREKINEWALWTYYYLIKSRWGDAPEANSPESLCFVLGLMLGAYESLLARFDKYEDKGAVLLTPSPEVASKYELIRDTVREARGPYELAYELSDVDEKTFDLVVSSPWVTSKFGKEAIAEITYAYKVFRTAEKIYEWVWFKLGKIGGDIDEEKYESIGQELLRIHPRELGRVVGSRGHKGYSWFLRLLEKELGFIPSQKWVEEFDKGFREGKELYYKLLSELGEQTLEGYDLSELKELQEKRDLKEELKVVEFWLRIYREAGLTPLEAIVELDATNLTSLFLRTRSYIEETLYKFGFNRKWVEEFLKHLEGAKGAGILDEFAEFLEEGDYLEDKPYNDALAIRDYLREKYDWKNLAYYAGLRPADYVLHSSKSLEEYKTRVIKALEEIYGNEVDELEAKKVLDEALRERRRILENADKKIRPVVNRMLDSILKQS